MDFIILISSSFISSLISLNSIVLKYLSPVSGSIAKITEPSSTVSANFAATAKVPPPEIPVRIPSCWASFIDVSIDSGPEILIRSSNKSLSIVSCSTNGIKSGVHPWIKWGWNAAWLFEANPSELLSWSSPDDIKAAFSGSVKIIFVSLSLLLISLAIPGTVPPVP